jgi:WD40 repeat protein
MDEKRKPASENPFKGLKSYEPSDRDAIFGRDMDFTLMRERLYSGRTTLLFAASGVGKSSFLKARLLPSVGTEFVTCYHHRWADEEPRTAVLRSIAASLDKTLPDDATLETALDSFRRRRREESAIPHDLPLRPVSSRAPDFLLVLDQFEELFQYYAFRTEFAVFLDELCTLVNSDEIGARLVVSMRDDFLGRLSVFDNRIPDLFNNYYRLKSPTKLQSMEIIQRTCGLANRRVDPVGLGLLVDDLATFRRAMPRKSPTGSDAPVSTVLLPIKHAATRIARPILRLFRAITPARMGVPPPVMAITREFVVPPYLQIVCYELWERSASDEAPFLVGYSLTPSRENAASAILVNFCRTRLNELKSARQRDLAARAFDFLMTRDGAKMAYQLGRLAEHMDVTKSELEPVLTSLSDEDTRLLRRFKGPDESWWYELYHDMYALILSDWKRWYQARRSRQNQVLAYAVVFALIFLGASVQDVVHNWNAVKSAAEDYPLASYDALSRKLTFGGTPMFMQRIADRPWADYLDRRAARFELTEDRDRALLFRLQSLNVRPTDERSAAVRRLVGDDYADALATSWRLAQPVRRLFFSPDEHFLFAATSDGLGQVWDLTTGAIASLATESLRGPSALRSATFTKSGTLLTLSNSVMEAWGPRPDRTEWQRTGCIVPAGNGRLELNIPRQRDCARIGFPPSELFDRVVTATRKGRSNSPRSIYPASIRAMEVDPTTDELLTATFAEFAASTGQVCAWDARTLIRRRCFINDAAAVQFDARTRRIAVLTGDFFRDDQGGFQLYDFSGHAVGPKSTIRSDFEPSIVFGSEGQSVHVVAFDGRVTTFEPVSGGLRSSRITEFQNDSVRSWPAGPVDLGSPDGRVWMADDALRLKTSFIRVPFTLPTSSPKGTYFVTVTPGDAVRFWRTDQLKSARLDWPSVNGRPAPAALSQTGPCAAYIDRERLAVRNLVTGVTEEVPWRTLTLRDRNKPPDRVAAEPSCRHVAVAWTDGRLGLWTVGNPAKPLMLAETPRPSSGEPTLLFSPNGNTLLAAWPAEPPKLSLSIQLWDANRGSLIREIVPAFAAVGGFSLGVASAVFTKDSQALAIAAPRTIPEIYATATGVRINVDLPIGAPIVSAGNQLAIAGASGPVIVTASVSAPSSVSLSQLSPVTSMSFSSDGSRIATVEAGALKIYDGPNHGLLPFQSIRRFSQAKFPPSTNSLLVALSTTGAQLLKIEQGHPGYVGLPVMIGAPPTGSGNEEVSPILAMEFSSDGNVVFIATRRWLHRLSITSTGLEAMSSRQLSAWLDPTNGIRLLDARGLTVAVIVQTGAASHVETIDFAQNPPLAVTRDLSTWEDKLGLHLDLGTGEIAFRAPVPR